MRKTLSILAVMALPLFVAAGPIDKERARQIASEFITDVSTRNASVMHRAPVSHQLTYKDAGYDHLYTFSDDKNGGFVVVAGDDRIAQPVLAYSETDHVNMYALPAVTQIMLQCYEEQLASLPPDYAPAAAPEASQREVIYPLLTSMWHQYLPFCYNTPYDEDAERNTLVGCVALVLSQLMYYWKYPSGTTQTIPAYTTYSGYDMPALPPTTFDYSKMHNNYRYISNRGDVDPSDPAVAEVTKLVLYTGCALKMNYSTGGSAAVFDTDTIAKYFNFDKGARRLMAGNYPRAIWEEMVYNELKAGRPVPYSAGAIGNQNHQFIIDGYDGKGLFHVNIGEIAKGSDNQYYRLGVINHCESQYTMVEFSGYNVHQAGIFGFQPDQGNDPVPVVSVDYGDYALSKTSFTRTSSSVDFTGIKLKGTMKRHDSNGLSMDYGWGLYQGGLLKQVVYSSTTSKTSVALNMSLSMGKGLPNGTYQLFPIFRNHGAEEWETYLEYGYTTEDGTPMRHFTATIEGNKLQIGVSSTEPNITIDKMEYYRAFEGERLHARAYLTNGGTNYENLLFFWIDGEMRTGVGAYVDPGMSDYVDFYTAAPSKGTHDVKITTDYDGKNIVYTGKLKVTATPEYKLETSYTESGTSYENGQGYIHGRLDVVCKIKNVGTTTYSDMIQGACDEYLRAEDGSITWDEDLGYDRFCWFKVWWVNLAPGESIEIPVSIGKEVFRPNDYFYSIGLNYYNNHRESKNFYNTGYFLYLDEVQPLLGDVNNDGLINMNDVTAMINYILGKNPGNFSSANAELNGDGYINMQDVTAIINIILGR